MRLILGFMGIPSSKRRMGAGQGGILLKTLLFLTLGVFGSAQSLYKEDTFRAPAADHKAFKVGDIIAVQVIENSAASSTADTTTQRNNNLNAGIASLMSGRQWGGSITAGGNFDGGGSTLRTNRLLATLSVSVQELLSNGDLRVAGVQHLTVNGEQHKVSLEGRIRPKDISSDNTVLSTRVADARIDYVGEGDLSKRQRRAWWRAMLDWMGF